MKLEKGSFYFVNIEEQDFLLVGEFNNILTIGQYMGDNTKYPWQLIGTDELYEKNEVKIISVIATPKNKQKKTKCIIN